MKTWLRYFRFWLAALGILIVIYIVAVIANAAKSGASSAAGRVNQVCTETERVFDYADVLTDEEEDSLRELIAQKEQETQCDIVLLLLNESLVDYAREYDPSASGMECAMIKADNFYDENGFGWNKYQESDDGDGVLLLDNYYRESDGNIYTWLSTSGKAMNRYSDAMIDHLLDRVYDYIETNPYRAYKAYIETFAGDMTGAPEGSIKVALWAAVGILPLVIMIIFILINLSGKEGKRTTASSTYVEGGRPDFKVNTDRFIRKTTTKRRIETGGSSGGGGGGGFHMSSGGHSHGGGGRSR